VRLVRDEARLFFTPLALSQCQILADLFRIRRFSICSLTKERHIGSLLGDDIYVLIQAINTVMVVTSRMDFLSITGICDEFKISRLFESHEL
jgi:hypothetical protein